jgi:AcrR family transcriptional regulator
MSKRKTVVADEGATAAVAERDSRPPVEAIRAAAFAQFAERGYPVVTVRDIMKACGLTQGALYNHFKSKDELLHDIITSTQSELERQCQQAVAGAGGDPRAELAAFVRVYVIRHCRLRHGVEKGVFDPPRIDGRHDLKAMAMALLDQCTHVSMWYGPGGDLTEEQMAKLYTDMALRMVGATPQSA